MVVKCALKVLTVKKLVSNLVRIDDGVDKCNYDCASKLIRSSNNDVG
jgi:hypothetical protein